MIGVLVKGNQGEDYLVTPGRNPALGSGGFQVFLRGEQGWELAALSEELASAVRAEAVVGLFKMGRLG